jgi:hypothetical protein
MPRISDRARLIRELEGITKERLTARLRRMVWDEDEDPVQDSLDVAVVQSLQKIRRSRYLYRPTKYRKGSAEDRFNTDLSNMNLRPTDRIRKWFSFGTFDFVCFCPVGKVLTR